MHGPLPASYAGGVAGASEDPVLAGKRASRRTEELLPPKGYWRVAQYADTIENAWSASERYRMLISDLPRRFHQSSRDRQECALEEPPRLTGTNWDALLAATAEHIAITRPSRAGLVRRPGAVAEDLLDAADGVRAALSGLCLPGHTRSIPAPWRHGR